MDNRIIKFLASRHIMTLSTLSEGGGVWCCNLFYALDKERGWLIFISSEATLHITKALKNPQVGVSVVLDTKVVGKIRGAQITGVFHDAHASGETLKICKSRYLKRFPYAALHLDHLWYVEISEIKYTDNRLGFGTKLHYTK